MIKADVKVFKKHKGQLHKNLKKVRLEIKDIKAKLRTKLDTKEETKLKATLREKLNTKSQTILEVTTIEEDIFIRLPVVEQTVITTVHQDVFYKANAAIVSQSSVEISQCEDIIVTSNIEVYRTIS
jgi:hypothetical protein